MNFGLMAWNTCFCHKAEGKFSLNVNHVMSGSLFFPVSVLTIVSLVCQGSSMIKSNDTQASLASELPGRPVKAQVSGLPDQSFWFSKGRDRRSNIPDKSPKWCCFWGLDHTLRTTAPEYQVLSLLEWRYEGKDGLWSLSYRKNRHPNLT